MKKKVRIVPKYIQDFMDDQKANGNKSNTSRDQISKLLVANDWKPIINWKKEDVTKYILYMKNRKLSDTFIEMVKSLLKKFFKFHNKEKFVEDIKIKLPRKKYKPTDILSPDDINKIIEASNNNRDKAFVAFLFESGGRISEVLKLKVIDIQDTERGMVINVPGTKTGEEYRPCLCVYSAQYIRNHILYPSLNSNDRLFNFSQTQARRILKLLKEKSRIIKPLNPQSFRHAQATYMVRKSYNETIIRAKLGWTDDSKMIAKYVSIDGNDIINATAEKEGNIQIPKELIKPINMADPIRIADPTLLINDMMHKNEEQTEALRNKIEALEDQNQKEHEEKLAEKHFHEQDLESYKFEMENKLSGMEKMIQNFMKKTQNPINPEVKPEVEQKPQSKDKKNEYLYAVQI
jgi:site-specific recombinase XerD